MKKIDRTYFICKTDEIKKNKRRLFALTLLFVFLISICNAYALTRADLTCDSANIAPTADFSVTKRKPIDIVIVTDYTGSKLSTLQNTLNNNKATATANGLSLQYNVINSNVNLGTQNSQVTINCYSRYIYFRYMQHNLSGYQAPGNVSKTDMVSYEYCELAPGESLPPFKKGSEVYYTSSYAEYQGMGFCYIGHNHTFYDPNNYSASKTDYLLIDQWSNGYDSTPSGYYVRSYDSFNYTATNYWSYSSSYQRDVTGDMYGLDFSQLNNINFRQGSEKYVLLITDNSNSVSYNLAWGNYYPFGSLRKNNLGSFIQNNDAHAYAICNNVAANINLSDYSSYKVNYSNSNATQDITIKELVNTFSTDGRVYDQGKIQVALDSIVNTNSKPGGNGNIDMVVATNKGSSIPSTFISNLKNTINNGNVDVYTTALDGSQGKEIGNLQKPSFKANTKTDYVYTGQGYANLILDGDGNLFVQGSNYCKFYPPYSTNDPSSYPPYKGLFGNASVDSYTDYTQIMSDVADAKFISSAYQEYYTMLVILKKDGTVWATGANIDGLLAPINNTSGEYTPQYVPTFTKINGLSNIKKFEYANYESNYRYWGFTARHIMMFFLSNDGKMYYLGYDPNGSYHPSTSDGNYKPVISTALIDNSISNVSDFAIKSDSWDYINTIYGCNNGAVYGRGRMYSIDVRSTDGWDLANTACRYLFYVPNGVRNVYHPQYGDGVEVITQNGDLYKTCKYSSYSTGLGKDETALTPKKILSDVKYLISKGSTSEYAITNSGNVYYWGYSPYVASGVLGYNSSSTYNFIYTPTLSNYINNIDYIYGDISNNLGFVIYKTRDGKFYYSGNSQYYRVFVNTPSLIYTNFTAIYPTAITPSVDLRINDYIYTNNQYGLMAVDLSGNLFAPSYDYTYNYTTGQSTYYFKKIDYGNVTAACNLTPVPIMGIDTEAIKSVELHQNSERYFVYISDSVSSDTTKAYSSYYPFGNLTDDFVNYLKTNNFNVYIIAPETALDFKLQAPYIPTTIQTKSLRDTLTSVTKDAAQYTNTSSVIPLIAKKFSGVQQYGTNSIYLICNEDNLDYNTIYDDFEVDPKYAEQWYFGHDTDYFESGTGLASFANKWVTNPTMTFDKSGHYTAKCRFQDNPKSNDDFSNYRLWSGDSPAFDIFVHYRPIANFAISLSRSGSNYVPAVTDLSYDLDHLSRADKGIVEVKWQWRINGNSTWFAGMLPATISSNTIYYLKMEVRDLEGAWSTPYVGTIDTSIVDLTPTVDANPQSYNGNQDLPVTITANDQGENDFNHTNYKWTQSISKPTSGWSSSTQKVFTNTLNMEGTFYLHMEVFDNAGHSFYRYRGPYTLIKNRPPAVNLTLSPSFIYESDNVTVHINHSDPDGDNLNIVLEQRFNSGSWNTIYTANNVLAGTPTTHVINTVSVGTYELRVTVTDKASVTATDSITFTPNALSITGFINHTALWNEHRITYNTSKGGNSNSPRAYNVFFPGERFLIAATTTVINPQSSVTASSVNVKINGQYYSTNLTNGGSNNWSGSIWHDDMIRWGNQDVTFNFTVTYSNGAIKTDSVSVRIIDDEYWRQHMKF